MNWAGQSYTLIWHALFFKMSGHINSIKNQIVYIVTTPPGSGAQLSIGRMWATL